MTREQSKIDILKAQHGIRTDIELAEKLGISQSSLSQRLSGKLSTGTIYLISNYFNVKPKELLK